MADEKSAYEKIKNMLVGKPKAKQPTARDLGTGYADGAG